MKLSPLRVLLALDAAVLFLLGALLILAPRRVEFAFRFKDLPEGVSYIIGLWGCVLVTMASAINTKPLSQSVCLRMIPPFHIGRRFLVAPPASHQMSVS